jgi:CRISPR-associated protein Csy3
MTNQSNELNNVAEALTLPSLLSFEGKFSCSDAILKSGVWSDWESSLKEKTAYRNWAPVKVAPKSVRGTISNHFSKKDSADYENDPAKLDKKIENANPQTVDHAALPPEHDLLRVTFTLKVLGKVAKPYACNAPDYQKSIEAIVNSYNEEHKFTEIAKRYAVNIANGRFLWRNRVGADDIKIHVKVSNEVFNFDAYDFSLRNFDTTEQQKSDLEKLSQKIAEALLGNEDHNFTLIEVDAYVNLGKNQTVYPSQEMVLGTSSGDQAKFLYEVNLGSEKIAAIHSQKIGNAIRTIDDWHKSGFEIGAIAVEPYGSVTNRGQAYRKPTKKEGFQDFYSLLDRWVNKGIDKPIYVDDLTDEQKHYVISVLIRGGVFSKAKDK